MGGGEYPFFVCRQVRSVYFNKYRVKLFFFNSALPAFVDSDEVSDRLSFGSFRLLTSVFPAGDHDCPV